MYLLKKGTIVSETPSSVQVNGSSITFTQLATEWLLQSSTILQNVFVTDASITALRKAEQFLWAGSEMDSVSSSYVFCRCVN